MWRTLGNQTTCELRTPVCQNSTVKFRVKNAFYKLKKIWKILLVGAPRFELGTSCAQGSGSGLASGARAGPVLARAVHAACGRGAHLASRASDRWPATAARFCRPITRKPIPFVSGHVSFCWVSLCPMILQGHPNPPTLPFLGYR